MVEQEIMRRTMPASTGRQLVTPTLTLTRDLFTRHSASRNDRIDTGNGYREFQPTVTTT
jgi:hypothetical protein